jgi:hypothetical protein
VRVDVVTAADPTRGDPLTERPAELASLRPEDVFTKRYHRDHQGPVPEALLAAFRELLEAVEHGDGT